MAAPGRHVGHCLQKNGQFLLNHVEKLWFRRGFHWSRVLHQQTAETTTESTESTESIVIPKKKTWSKVAVLEALASTVNKDPTATAYQFQDDTYLSPRTSSEFTVYSLSQASGRTAAKYFINNHPNFFNKGFAEPPIPCLMPESVSPILEEVSEAALKERLSLRRVTASVEMFDQLLQSGVTVSMETTHDLLDLISFYCDRDPEVEPPPQQEEEEVEGEEPKRIQFSFLKVHRPVNSRWKENNNAERIFSLLPERDTRCYSALIRGMVKYGAFDRAFLFYKDLLNNRLTGDSHMFDALISATPQVQVKYGERWSLISELLQQMQEQKVQPTLLTFNAVFCSMRSSRFFLKTHASSTLNEMKALGIAPSLGTYRHILNSCKNLGTDSVILQDIMSEIEGTHFTCQDSSDIFFFMTAMSICVMNKDLELAYKVQTLVETGENWRLLGNTYYQSVYYGNFFNILCMMERVDVVLKWYRKLIPSMFYPNPNSMRKLLQALDTDSRLDLLPTIWKDICFLKHDNKKDLVEELLGLMSRDKHDPEMQQAFAECALDVKAMFDREVRSIEWTTVALCRITTLLLRGQGKEEQAWNMLKLFESGTRIPTDALMEEFLTSLVSSKDSERAVKLIQISASFFLPCTPKLAETVEREFSLSETQRSILSELGLAAEPSE